MAASMRSAAAALISFDSRVDARDASSQPPLASDRRLPASPQTSLPSPLPPGGTLSRLSFTALAGQRMLTADQESAYRTEMLDFEDRSPQARRKDLHAISAELNSGAGRSGRPAGVRIASGTAAGERVERWRMGWRRDLGDALALRSSDAASRVSGGFRGRPQRAGSAWATPSRTLAGTSLDRVIRVAHLLSLVHVRAARPWTMRSLPRRAAWLSARLVAGSTVRRVGGGSLPRRCGSGAEWHSFAPTESRKARVCGRWAA